MGWIPGPRPITIDDCLKGAEEIRGQTMNLTCIDETQTLTTLNEIFKRTYGKFDHAGYWQSASFKLMHENGFTK